MGYIVSDHKDIIGHAKPPQLHQQIGSPLAKHQPGRTPRPVPLVLYQTGSYRTNAAKTQKERFRAGQEDGGFPNHRNRATPSSLNQAGPVPHSQKHPHE